MKKQACNNLISNGWLAWVWVDECVGVAMIYRGFLVHLNFLRRGCGVFSWLRCALIESVGRGLCLLSRKEKGPIGGDISLLAQELVLSQCMRIVVGLSQHGTGRDVEQMFSVRVTALI